MAAPGSTCKTSQTRRGEGIDSPSGHQPDTYTNVTLDFVGDVIASTPVVDYIAGYEAIKGKR